MVAVFCLNIIVSFSIDYLWGKYVFNPENPAYITFRSTCYWSGDARTLTRIALYGYSDWFYDLSHRHITDLPDRSWWPVFPVLTAGMIALTGNGQCSGWWVNLIAVTLLVPVIQALTKTRRLSLLIGLMFIPFSLWLYIGMAEGVFLLFSGLLWLVCLQGQNGIRRRNLAAGIGALLLGMLVGLTKPNSLALMPAFLVLAIMQSAEYLKVILAADCNPPLPTAQLPTPPRRHRLLRLLSDDNPAWASLLAVVGIALGNGLWIYQTSGYYPFYVVMVQRTLWFKQFRAGDLLSMLSYFYGGVFQTFTNTLDDYGLVRIVRLTAVFMAGGMMLQGLRPRWPGSAARPVPLYARFSLLAVLTLMFSTGQAHAINRYMMGNIFFVVLYLQYVYGAEGEPPLWRLRAILRREPGTFGALLRIAAFWLGPLLTLIVMATEPRLPGI